MKKRSQIFRDSMKYLAASAKDRYNRKNSAWGICAAVSFVDSSSGHLRWLFNDGRGRRIRFDANGFWVPINSNHSYTARIMLLELGALLSEEEGN